MMLEIVAIKTKNKYYLSTTDDLGNDNRWSHTPLKSLLINGKKPESSYDIKWVAFDEIPTRVERVISQCNINHRFVLTDESLQSENIPLVIYNGNGCHYDDKYNFEWVLDEKYEKYASLYVLVSDKQDDILEDVEFTFKILYEYDIDDLSHKPVNFKSLDGGNGGKEYTITNGDLEHQLIDKIIFPSILLYDKPVRISSKQLYDILRYEIKLNIDHRYAEITSDYDFCFTVKKRIALDEPYTEKWEIKKANGRSYAKPRFRETYINSKLIEVFEMTNDKHKYRDYTVIPGIEAVNAEELEMKIKRLSGYILKRINEPLIECPTCKGRGVIMDNIIDVFGYINKLED